MVRLLNEIALLENKEIPYSCKKLSKIISRKMWWDKTLIVCNARYKIIFRARARYGWLIVVRGKGVNTVTGKLKFYVLRYLVAFRRRCK